MITWADLGVTSDGVVVVAEAGQCAGDNLDLAITMVRAAAGAKAWGYKVQILDPDTLCSSQAAKYWDDEHGTADQAAAFRAAGVLPYGEWASVGQACRNAGISFGATPFDAHAVEVAVDAGCEWLKVASGDLTNLGLLEDVLRTGLPLVVSTGAATIKEILDAQSVLWGAEVIWLACTLNYPTDFADANLARIASLAGVVYPSLTGYSDHTLGIRAALGAAACGAVMLEKHYTLRRDGRCADQQMAVDDKQLVQYVKQAKHGSTLHGSRALEPVDAELRARQGARRSLFATRDLAVGETPAREDVIALRPGGVGASPMELLQVIARPLTREVRAGEPMSCNSAD